MLYAICDGVCSPNPNGICACAFIIKDDKSIEIYRFSKIIGSGIGYTNNVGEYAGLEEVLKWFSSREEKELTVVSDSKLVINQMNGKWEAKGGVYFDTYCRVIVLRNLLLSKGKKLYFNWVPREYIIEVDRLANQVIAGKISR